MGTSQDYRVAVEEGATCVRLGSVLWARLSGLVPSGALPFRAQWASPTSGAAPSSTSASPRRTTTGTRTATPPTRSSSARTTTARTSAGCRAGAEASYDDWTDSDTAAGQVEVAAPAPRSAREQAAPARPRRLEAAPSPNVKVHLVLPRSFNDAQQIADKFKDGIPVILNLQSDRPGALQAPDRLRERPDLRPQRRHAARRRQGLPAHARGTSRSPPRSAPGSSSAAASSTRPKALGRQRSPDHPVRSAVSSRSGRRVSSARRRSQAPRGQRPGSGNAEPA